MDVREMIRLVEEAQEQGLDYYNLATKIVEAQKETDAKLAETMGATSVAAAIRVAT